MCEECNCDPAGVPPTFFDDGGCANVAPGTLCTCKERVTGRICDTCKPLFWKLEANNPLGCTGKLQNVFVTFRNIMIKLGSTVRHFNTSYYILDCGCHRPGTIGGLGVCDLFDGQCACKPFVGTPPPGDEARVCSACKDGYYGLEVRITRF